MSAFGPKQTSACVLQESAFRGKADIVRRGWTIWNEAKYAHEASAELGRTNKIGTGLWLTCSLLSFRRWLAESWVQEVQYSKTRCRPPRNLTSTSSITASH